ncbi:MAG: anaerobic sulfatase maturase [bacterium]
MPIKTNNPRVNGQFHLMLKPTGAACNLSCDYCYYLSKSQLYPNQQTKMDIETLERITAAYIQAHPGPEIVFGWQGGEPLMMGIDFFRHALDLQKKYTRPGLRISNAIQTNATLIDDDWAAFFYENKFLVGVSIDGPIEMHDYYRKDKGGKPSHAKVLTAINALQRNKVEFNALVTVNKANVEHPLRVYRFLTGLGIDFIQFIPIVEKTGTRSRQVTPFTVDPDKYGDFLCQIFDYWSLNDVGRVFVQLFESTLSSWMGHPATVCVYAQTCGMALAVEHNGDLFACDHYVYPEYFRGNISDAASLKTMIESREQLSFGRNKADNLPYECRKCDCLVFCNGDCPKHRLRLGRDNKLYSYLCPGLKRFFHHTAPVFKAMAQELRAGRPATNVMITLREMEEIHRSSAAPRRATTTSRAKK